MRLVAYYLSFGLAIWLTGACKRTAPEIAPTAMDSIGVVGTLVSAKDLMVGKQQASIVALAVDPVGNLYAADVANHLIRKITPLGEVSTFAGSGQVGYQNGPAALSQFSGLVSLACDKVGNLYVGEGFENTCIRKISTSGLVSTFAGQPFLSRSLPFNPSSSPDGLDTAARFIIPIALAFDSSDNLYASDVGSINRYASNAIRKITLDGYVRTIAGYASGIAIQGQLLDNTPYPYRFLSIAVTKANAIVGVDQLNQLLYQITPAGNISLFVPSKTLTTPRSLVYDQSDNLLVANGQEIVQVSPSRLVSVLAGSSQSGFVNDSLKSARFSFITALAVDQKNTLYIADDGNHCIRRVRLN